MQIEGEKEVELDHLESFKVQIKFSPINESGTHTYILVVSADGKKY
jgi:hypothetical protein